MLPDGTFFLSFAPDQASLKTFSVVSRGPKSIVKIELEVADPYTLSNLTRDLHEVAAAAKPVRRQPRGTK